MKKLVTVILLLGFLGIMPAFADEKKMMDKKDMKCHGMMGMMSKSMVASGDGGVIVQSGNKLLKYDKDLNLVKETELPMEMKKEMCDMCKKKMAEKEGAATDAVKSAEKPVSEGHAAHH